MPLLAKIVPSSDRPGDLMAYIMDDGVMSDHGYVQIEAEELEPGEYVLNLKVESIYADDPQKG